MNEAMLDSMETSAKTSESAVASCPMQNTNAMSPRLEPDDELIFPNAKRVVATYVKTDAGETELHLHYGEKGLFFDDPDFFAFGETLAKQSRFVAKAAVTWGHGYEWQHVQELLELLLEEGILRHAHADDNEQIARGLLPSPLPPARSTEPRGWFDCEAITRELTGRTLELGYLEAVVPIFRVAHIAVDAEGRQVGEANVFPSALRLDVPTEWRRCPYPGSRYQDDFPMNVTALKSMNKYWKPMMVILQRSRSAYLERFPQARHGWTVGDLQRLSTLVLAVPTYLLMRDQPRVENGNLHPILSSMFRITDGVRMTMHEMLFTPVMEPVRADNAPMTSAELYAYAERNNVFLSDHGVCAGPKTLIEEFLHVFIDGKPIEGADDIVFDADVQMALDALTPAFDYGLYGLQTHAIVFSLWTRMSRAYERLLPLLEAGLGAGSDAFRSFRDRLRQSAAYLSSDTLIGTETWRQSRDKGLADMYAQCATGLGVAASGATLTERLLPAGPEHCIETTERLYALLQRRFYAFAPANDNGLAKVIDVLMDYFRQEQAIVRAASEVQQHINNLLGRTPPKRPLTASNIAIYYRLQDVGKRLPYLVDEIEETLDLRIAVGSDDIEIVDLETC